MRGVSVRALVVATLVSYAMDIISSLVLTIALGGDLLAENLSQEQEDAALRALSVTPAFLSGALILGTLSTIVGGYIAARIAPSLPYMNAFAFGVVAIVLSVIMRIVMTQIAPPLWYEIIGFGVLLPAAVFGGHIVKRQRQTPPS